MADPSHDAITNEMQQEWEKGNRVGELRAGEVVIPPNGYIGAVVYAAVCFLLVFTSFNTAASTLTLIFPTFGSTNLMIIFYVFGVFSIVAPAIVARLDPKWCIVLSTLCFTFWIGTLMSGILGLVIFGSVMVGVASGVIWVATGPYLGRSRRGSLANNVFWLIFFTSWLFGGVIGGIVLNYLDKQAYQAIMLSISGVGCAMMLFIRKLPPQENEVHDLSFVALFRPFRLLAQKPTLFVLPTYATRTCMLGFFLAQFPALVGNVSLIPYLTISTAVCLFGLGLTFIFVWDKVHFAVWATIHALVVIVAMILSALIAYNVISGEARLIVLYVIAGAFGLSESFGMALVSHYGQTFFPGELGSFFGVCRCVEGFSVATIVVLATYTLPIVVVSVISFLALCSITCNLVLVRYVAAKKREALTTQYPLHTLDIPVVIDKSKQPNGIGVRQATFFRRN